MARPLKKLPRKQISMMVTRLRTRNNRYWGQLRDIALETPRGRKVWRKIMATDLEIHKWGSRI